jgi:hypothetical protein
MKNTITKNIDKQLRYGYEPVINFTTPEGKKGTIEYDSGILNNNSWFIKLENETIYASRKVEFLVWNLTNLGITKKNLELFKI